MSRDRETERASGYGRATRGENVEQQDTVECSDVS